MTEITLEEVLNNITDSIIVTDAKGVVLYTNTETAVQMGMTVDEIVGKSVQQLLERKIYDKSMILQAIEERRAITGISITFRGQYLLSKSVPVFNENGELVMVVTTTLAEELSYYFNRQIEEKKKQIDAYRQSMAYISKKNNRFLFADQKMSNIADNLSRVAKTDSTILLYGESGVGKEVLANFVHGESARADEPFIPVNCSAIPTELFESEFFGYVKGAFTGASAKGHMGFFEMANKGTLFLDEIGELPKFMQSKLLRVVETGEIKKIGGSEIINTDVRIIAATNRNLEKMVSENEFREDLYYRLNVMPIHVPPLRERREDIMLIANDCLKRLNDKYRSEKCFSEFAKSAMLSYQWPGNIRELRNIVERAFILSGSDTIEQELGYLIKINPADESGELRKPLAFSGTLKEAVENFEKEYIKRTLEENSGNISDSAEKLGIHRATLHRKLAEGTLE